MHKWAELKSIPVLKVQDVSFAYNSEAVLEDISFHLNKGEHLAIMGESGCGKSTLLKILYGILPVDEGELHWGFKQSSNAKFSLVPGRSGIKYLSQGFDLMPFTTVRENISEFLSVFEPEHLEKRTKELLGVIDMLSYANTKVKHLSVGQQQRVALARVLAQKPDLLLLDEPFSHIDNFRKNALRRNLFEYLAEEGISCITATHDHQDVLAFADRVLILKDREILVDAPLMDVFQNPKSLYIASLFGEANLIPIEVVKSYADTKRRIIVYAHEFKISKNSGLPVVVLKSYPMGHYYLLKGEGEGQEILFTSDKHVDPGTELFLNIPINIINRRMAL